MRFFARTIIAVLLLLSSAVTVRAEAPVEQLRVLLVGSSSMKGALGHVLQSSLEQWSDVEVRRVGIGSSGLARPDFFDWMSELERQRDEFGPHVVIVNLGANDAQGIWTTDGWIRWGKRGWSAEYQARVDRILEMMRGRRVFWIGPPNMRKALFSKRLLRISRAIREVASRHRHAEFVDAYSLTSGPDGKYVLDLVDFQGGIVTSRTEDGIHFTRRGAFLIAARILEPLAAEIKDVREAARTETAGAF